MVGNWDGGRVRGVGIGREGWEGGWDENGVVDGVAGDDGEGGEEEVVGRHESGVIDGVIGNDEDGGMGQVGWGHGLGWLAREHNDRRGHGIMGMVAGGRGRGQGSSRQKTGLESTNQCGNTWERMFWDLTQ